MGIGKILFQNLKELGVIFVSVHIAGTADNTQLCSAA